MSDALWYLLIALAAGICIPVQAGINAQLAQHVRSAEASAFVSFSVGTLALAAYLVLARIPLPLAEAWRAAPWWNWIGGTLGAFLVAVTVLLVPRLGAGTMIAFIVAGQMLASLGLDHFGWLGYAEHPVSWQRALGALLLVAGVALIRLF